MLTTVWSVTCLLGDKGDLAFEQITSQTVFLNALSLRTEVSLYLLMILQWRQGQASHDVGWSTLDGFMPMSPIGVSTRVSGIQEQG